MTSERRRSPRRKIAEIKRVGAWGHVSYHHVLACGHTEIRKRAASTGELACAWCLRAEQKASEIRALVGPRVIRTEDEALADDEVKIERTRAALATRFSIPVDAVDVLSEDISGQLVIRSATIFLSARDVTRLVDTR